jgi:hypothetical protein
MLRTGCPDPCNMFQECFRLHIPDPHISTYGSVCAQIMVTEQEIKRLSKDAPTLCRQHLLDLIEDAERHDDTTRAKAILENLRREEQKKQWQRINHSTHPPPWRKPYCDTSSDTNRYREVRHRGHSLQQRNGTSIKTIFAGVFGTNLLHTNSR